MALLDYDDPASWPSEVVVFLDEHRAALEDWGTSQRFTTGQQYDRLIEGLGEALQPHEILAWHCTRLMAHEVADIATGGLTPPSVDRLMCRIDAAVSAGAFPPAIAAKFRVRHQAHSPTRAGRIWFLLTRPRHDDGVEDFFRFWGGEALYAAIDRDPELGLVLRSTGTPSVVEVALPISYLRDSLGYESDIVRQFCAWRAGRSYDGVPYDRVLQAVPPKAIQRIVTFHDPDFTELSGCSSYFEPLKVN
ncbi:hypothetical protein [Sphingobium chungangianum]